MRAERQRLIASNIANADTPGYVGRDADFKAAMRDATGGNNLSVSLSAPSGSTESGIQTSGISHYAQHGHPGGCKPGVHATSQPAMDGNSVDMDRERGNFVDNAVRYEATLRFINGQSKTVLSAIQRAISPQRSLWSKHHVHVFHL